MSCVFLRKGTTFTPTDPEKLNIHEQLPPGNYNIFVDDHGNFHFSQIDSFELPPKLYGDTTKIADRILNSFNIRTPSTGVLLSGTKGSGKSLLAKVLSAKGAEAGIPTIVINAPWKGDAFNKLIQDISQPCIVLFDEFEKIYDKDEQEKLLTLLDGVYNSKKLFVFTCNNVYRIDTHMINRPGRIFYKKHYKGLDLEFIREYCGENLNDQQYIDKICNISTCFSDFNFDMLKALIEEMNRYNESPDQALLLLNVTPDGESDDDFDVKLIINGELIPDSGIPYGRWEGQPLKDNIEICYDPDPSVVVEKYKSKDYSYANFTCEDLVQIDAKTKTFTFIKGNDKLVLTRYVKMPANYYNAF